MRAFVIGGSGFIGREIINALRGKGLEVLAYEHKTPIKGVKTVKGGLRGVIKHNDYDVLFHLAKFSHSNTIGRFLKSLWGYFLNSDIVRVLKGRKLVYFSGSLVYGGGVANENSPIKPVGFARFYFLQEKPFLKYKNALILRPGWVLGDGSWFKRFYLNVMLRNGFVPIYGHGENIMSLITLKDCAILSTELALKCEIGIYNLFSEHWKQKHFAELLSDITGFPIKKVGFWEVLNLETWEALTHSLKLETIREINHGFVPIKEYVMEILKRYGF
ncbi:MAG: NAD(P)-dependent oxidoreductase [candidate division WOR-3 bacterium]